MRWLVSLEGNIFVLEDEIGFVDELLDFLFRVRIQKVDLFLWIYDFEYFGLTFRRNKELKSLQYLGEIVFLNKIHEHLVNLLEVVSFLFEGFSVLAELFPKLSNRDAYNPKNLL